MNLWYIKILSMDMPIELKQLKSPKLKDIARFTKKHVI